MTINYKFQGEFFDYEVEHDRYLVALFNILSKEEKGTLIGKMLDSDGCVINLEDDYKEELVYYFEKEAYREFKDRRCE